MSRLIYSLVTILLALLLVSCTSRDGEEPLRVLRIGILPDESEEELYRRYTPLLDYLEQETGLSIKLNVPDSYKALLELFAAKTVDLAYFGGFTFVKANMEHAAVPLVMRDVDTRFTSVFIVNGKSRVRELQDTGIERFSFGSRLSTSGHLMPRHFMASEKGIIPEEHYSSVRYSGRHDLTAFWVRDGEVDLGVANARIVRNMLDDGRLNKDAIRIIWETPTYPDYVWAIQATISQGDREKIRQAFLRLSVDNTSHAPILENLDTGGFFPASEQDFLDLKTIVVTMEAGG